MPVLYLPDYLYCDGTFKANAGLLVDDDGTILDTTARQDQGDWPVVRLKGKALLPGLVNSHSHTFQRLIRGVAEHAGVNGDDFWAWRNTMYAAASNLGPDDLYDVARMAFLEMVLSGMTAVGEFHYLHRQQDGSAYDDPNLLAKRIIDAAASVGIRICLLRVAYERAGYALPPHPGQTRFYETGAEFLANAEALRHAVTAMPATVSFGVAPHSIRATTLHTIKQINAWAREHDLPIHMHIAEQVAEITACEREHGCSPVQLLKQAEILAPRLTLVHAIHLAQNEVAAIAETNSIICACPTTERNLGDGIVDADDASARGIAFCFGSDSQATINLLEDARELDYHLRLKRQRRVLLDQIDGEPIARRLFRYATAVGARSLGMQTGILECGRPADFFCVDLADVSIAGADVEELLSTIVFSLERTAVRDVVVNGRTVVSGGRHALAAEIVLRYGQVARRIAEARA